MVAFHIVVGALVAPEHSHMVRPDTWIEKVHNILRFVLRLVTSTAIPIALTIDPRLLDIVQEWTQIFTECITFSSLEVAFYFLKAHPY